MSSTLKTDLYDTLWINRNFDSNNLRELWGKSTIWEDKGEWSFLIMETDRSSFRVPASWITVDRPDGAVEYYKLNTEGDLELVDSQIAPHHVGKREEIRPNNNFFNEYLQFVQQIEAHPIESGYYPCGCQNYTYTS